MAFNARITHKHDTEANWKLATNFKPLAGEIIIYDADSTHNYRRVKIGDGNTYVNALPFIDDALREEVKSNLAIIATSDIDKICNGTN